MKKLLFIALSLLSIPFVVTYAQNSVRNYKSISLTGDALNILVSDGQYRIKVYSPDIIETSFSREGETNKFGSSSIISAPISLDKNKITETSQEIILNTGSITVKIKKIPFQISYFYDGKPLVSEKNGYVSEANHDVIDFNIDESEILYGGGERVLGMNRRGNKLEMYNRAHYGYSDHSELMNYCIPLVLSSKMYAIHFDNPTIANLDLDSKHNNTLAYEHLKSGRKVYQVIAGKSWEKLIENYIILTGHQPMPPRWTFGSFASRFGYHSQNEVENTVKKFKEENIPLDAIVLDLYWFGKDIQGSMGNLAFDPDSFPRPKEMINNLKKDGVETILITEPFILTTSDRWEDAVNNKVLGTDWSGKPLTYDFFFGNTGLVDVFDPKAESWFWDIYKGLKDEYNIGGWWGDLGEPEMHPSNMYHHTGTADEVHNIYGHAWSKLIADGYKKDYPDERLFMLMRAGYSGTQRYGIIPWTGDVGRSWESLHSQLELSLQMGMQGLAYLHSDLGGFAGDQVNDPLYVRWLQYGVFQPVFRPHAQETVPCEIVFRTGETKRLAKEAVELRSKLMPYNYTLAFKNNCTGIPFMRPLFFAEPDNKELLSTSEYYLWGNDFLIAPITDSLQQIKPVYFPKNSNWFDFYIGEKYTGGKMKDIAVHTEYIPTFVRGGAFIPMKAEPVNVKDYNLNEFDLHYYFDTETKQSKSEIYNDDGTTSEAFEKGMYELIETEAAIIGKNLNIKLTNNPGSNFKSSDKNINLIVHNISKPKSIKVKDGNIQYEWDSNKKTLTIPIRLSDIAAINIQM